MKNEDIEIITDEKLQQMVHDFILNAEHLTDKAQNAIADFLFVSTHPPLRVKTKNYFGAKDE